MAAEVIEHAAKSNGIGSLTIGATRLLAHGLYRKDGDRRNISVCPPETIYLRVFQAIDRDPRILAGRPVEYVFALISRLPSHNQALVEMVAKSAFSPHVEPGEGRFTRDIRPLARTTLAGLGSLAEPWRDQAFAQMSSDNALGTGAAQVAVAAGHPEALQRVVTLMNGLLRSVPEGQVIKWDMRHRLKELSYAIVFSEDKASSHIGPIKAFMCRKVQNPAPPFGMLELDPTDMCGVLRLIEGDESPAAMEFAYCSAPE